MAAKTFRVKVEADGNNGAWCTVTLPFDVKNKWGSAGRVSVKGTANGFAFRSSVFPRGDGTHFMVLNKAMQAGAGVKPGEFVRVTMDVDRAERVVTVPADLAAAMRKNAKARQHFAALAPSHRKGYVDWIESAKREETRLARVAKAVERLERAEKFF
jgi:hypothetical protein